MAQPRKTFAKLSPSDKFYIEAKRASLTPKEIAKDINTTPGVVSKYIEGLPPLQEPGKPTEEAKPTPDIKPEDSITNTPVFRHTPIVREEDGITIQTPQASQWSDEIMKRLPTPNYIEANSDRIHRPNPTKPSR